MLNAYIIHPEYKKELKKELLNQIEFETEEIFFSKIKISSVWSLNSLHNIQIKDFNSIKDASNILKAQKPIWFNLSQKNHRRAELVQENLRSYKQKEISFLQSIETQKLGIWGLLDQNKLFYSTDFDCPIPHGKVVFEEDKSIPPSRAYLKLWELFTVYKIVPQKTDVTLDMGSCPGGWSWVLSQVSKKVLSVDKAPLDPKIIQIPNIEFIKKDAFKLNPQDLEPVDWFFSDIICEPERLFELYETWAPCVKHFVCTVKFKGETDFKAIEKFQKLQPNLLKHFFNNKHEITFVKHLT